MIDHIFNKAYFLFYLFIFNFIKYLQYVLYLSNYHYLIIHLKQVLYFFNNLLLKYKNISY